MACRLVLLVALIVGSSSIGGAQVTIENLGIPVKAVTFGNSHGVLARSPGGDEGMFYIPYYSTTGSELIGIHPDTGEHVSIQLGSSGGYGCTVGHDGVLYIGGVNPGNLYRYDPVTGEVENLGGAQSGAQYIWDAATAPDGRIYGATYPTCGLLEYDPQTETLQDLGRLAEDRQYSRSVAVDPHGKVWVGVGVAGARLYVVDPDSGESRDVFPEEFREANSAYDLHVSGDYVFCATVRPGHLLVFDAASQSFIRSVALPPGEGFWMCGNSGEGGVIYPRTVPSDNLYRYNANTDTLELLAEAMGQAEMVVQDRFVHTIIDQDYVYYDLAEDRELFRKRLTEAGEGMAIHALTAGLNGVIYGGTYINQHLFHFVPETGEMADLGKVIRWGGQIDSMHGGRDDRIYMGCYVNANMAVYDPSRPWQPGRDRDGNPRELGMAGKGQYRTRCIVLGPDGNVYMGTIPSYGSAPTGGLARWDAGADEITCWIDFVPGGTVEDLRADNDWVYGHGGGEFFVMDTPGMEKVFTAPLRPTALEVAGNGQVLASVGDEIAVFDPREMQFVEPLASPAGGLTEMALLPDGMVAGINESAVVIIDPVARTVERIAAEGGQFLVSDHQGRLYFARGAQLMRLVR